jgi:Zn-finger in ubiquitin-hydrolases and other protein
MIKHKDSEEGKDHQVVCNIQKNQIWCYACDDMADNQIQFFKQINDNYYEDPEYVAYEAFFEAVCGIFVDVKIDKGDS